MHVVPGPSSIDSTSLLSPVSCPVTAWRNNLGPETAIATAPVGAVRRMDSTAMVKICSEVQMSKYVKLYMTMSTQVLSLVFFAR